ncbi:MAG: hypothetical protein ABIL58_14590 [Pseudomonadota bacterium]
MIALSLLKHVYALVDMTGQRYELNCLRTKDKAEVDFCIVKDGIPELLIEVKRSDPEPSNALVRFSERYNIPGIQLVLYLKREREIRGIELRRVQDYLSGLAM